MTKVSRLVPSVHARAVCMMGKGAATCRYLLGGPAGLECGKWGEHHDTIDRRVLAGTFVARGDNCPGITHPDTVIHDR